VLTGPALLHGRDQHTQQQGADPRRRPGQRERVQPGCGREAVGRGAGLAARGEDGQSGAVWGQRQGQWATGGELQADSLKNSACELEFRQMFIASYYHRVVFRSASRQGWCRGDTVSRSYKRLMSTQTLNSVLISQSADDIT
jgi:hypothetical protein